MGQPKKILVIDDDIGLSSMLRIFLEKRGFIVDTCSTGEEGLTHIHEHGADLVLLDLNLPGMSGLEVSRRLRAALKPVLVIMVTGRNSPDDEITGYAVGTHHYVTKPFEVSLLLAKINALFDAAHTHLPTEPNEEAQLTVISCGPLTLNRQERKLYRNGVEEVLNNREYQTLEYFMLHPGQAIKRNTLVEQIWQFELDMGSRTLDGVIVRLRKVIEDDPRNPEMLVTVHGFGYRFECQSKGNTR